MSPYAAKAKIEHEFEVDHLNIWLTFRLPMDISVTPLLSSFIVRLDGVAYPMQSVEWVDQFTLLLQSGYLEIWSGRLTVEFLGPDSGLQTSWGKDWEAWGEILSTDLEAYLLPAFVDRGDASAFDFTVSDFTTDGNWHDLDFSSIVPAEAKAVKLKLDVVDNLPQQYIIFRKDGNTNIFNVQTAVTQVANVFNSFDLIIALPPSRIVEYLATATTWSGINALVTGWFF
jgi:hypothetical protein